MCATYEQLGNTDNDLPINRLATNTTNIENTIANVSNWMSSNCLYLNPSIKPEFLIFGLQTVSQLIYVTLLITLLLHLY